ncbi:hypothetical protein [Lichenihabitans psoromatis]|uniref:hypothetical protein n=1 Tax=Lichenihabitans psoromatis TaxID=2528642 RepID=UPI0010361A1B|nr:hypothetical protein [Lichenihabitans psoromatis]
MTKPTGKGRGGARSGTGPKTKPDLGPTEAPAIEVLSPLKGSESAEDLAKHYQAIAIHTLAHIATQGFKESSRVSAANAILDRALGKPKSGAKPAPEPGATSKPVDDGGWGDLIG